MTVPKTIIRPIKDTLRNLMIATAILYLCLFAAGAYVYLENNTTTAAICALRTDLEVRTEGGKVFLKDHPHGIPGITPGQIEESIHNQERSIAALSILDC